MHEIAVTPSVPTPTILMGDFTSIVTILATITVASVEPKAATQDEEVPAPTIILWFIAVPTVIATIVTMIVYFSSILRTASELISISILILNHLRRQLRTHISPFILYSVLRLTPPHNLATSETLVTLMVGHLSRHDLVLCCRVSRLFFEVAGRELYGSSTGLIGGKENFYSWLGGDYPLEWYLPLSVRTRPALFAGIARAEAYDVSGPIVPQLGSKLWNAWAGYTPQPPQPSKLKRALLRHVLHLTYGLDILQNPDYDHIPSRDLFPSLVTLTLPYIRMYKVYWELPLRVNLRPRHIRLTLIRALGTELGHHPYYLGSDLGSRVEKVTLHFVDCRVPVPFTLRTLTIGWPRSMSQIDLVFMVPTPSSALGYHSFAHPLPVLLPFMGTEIRLVALTVSYILPSAFAVMSAGGCIRIIGLGERSLVDVTSAESTGSVQAKGENLDIRFAAMLEEEYAKRLTTKGVAVGEAGLLAGRLEFLGLKDYMKEKAVPPF